MINDAFSTCLEWSCPHRTVITRSQAAAAQHNCFLFVDLVYWGERRLWLGEKVFCTVNRGENVCVFRTLGDFMFAGAKRATYMLAITRVYQLCLQADDSEMQRLHATTAWICAGMTCSHKLSVRKRWEMPPSHMRSKTATDLLCKVTAKHWYTQVFSMHGLCSVMYNLRRRLTSRSIVLFWKFKTKFTRSMEYHPPPPPPPLAACLRQTWKFQYLWCMPRGQWQWNPDKQPLVWPMESINLPLINPWGFQLRLAHLPCLSTQTERGKCRVSVLLYEQLSSCSWFSHNSVLQPLSPPHK